MSLPSSTEFSEHRSIRYPVTPDAVARIPREFAFRYDILPLTLGDGVLTVAAPDVDDVDVLDHVRRVTRLRIEAIGMPRAEIRERLQAAYGREILFRAVNERGSGDSPAVRIVDSMLHHAVMSHASDVHIEPRHAGGIVRLRVDGVLSDVQAVAPEYYAALVSRLKLQAGMDIADRRQPQDGRFTITCENREIDARVSSMPTIDGEKLVIRLLDLHSQACRLDELGMPPAIYERYRDLVHRPWGFMVVTGPTGSGKTTTLYASLADLDARSTNLCSVEDPIEMRMSGVTQVGVNARAGLSFATILRSFMRQDPNVLMVGEMRDAETAAVAIAGSLAGQLVFTSLHSNDAPRTIERLVELGVARQSIAAGLTAVLAQRLIRRLCEQCRQPSDIPTGIRQQLGLDQRSWWTAQGCRACGDTGFSGRIGVYELLDVDDRLRDAIGAGASSVALTQLGRDNGYRPMFWDGLSKVCAGVTSYHELLRVVGAMPPA